MHATEEFISGRKSLNQGPFAAENARKYRT